MLKKAFRLTVCLLGLSVLCIYGGGLLWQPHAQSTEASLQGVKGHIRVLTNEVRREVTIVVALDEAQTGKSKQIVFHAQNASRRAPDQWSGYGEVLFREDLLAVVPQSSPQALVFAFPGAVALPNLAGHQITSYPIVGLARFGEHKPLTDAQIEELSQTGRVSNMGGEVLWNTVKFVPDVTFMRAQNTGQDCVAGGPGSTSCSAGGCTVTCQTNYHSCCSAGTCLCYSNQ